MKKTILFGNGMNRFLSGGVTWENMLKDLSEEYKVDSDELIEANQYTMVYEQIVLSEGIKEYHLKKNIAKRLTTSNYSDSYSEIFQVNAENYLTTNYEHFLEEEAKKELLIKEIENTEKIYSVRRKVNLSDGNRKIAIWNIHGSIRQPESIMLGLDHYCGYIGKIDDYIKGKYKYQIDKKQHKSKPIIEKLKKGSFDNGFLSWIDLFFMTDVFILGFGMAYSETDLWWILNRRARLKKNSTSKLINNRIVYYGECDAAKKNLFKSFDVEVIEKGNESYEDFFRMSLNHINEY